jgi:selenocysteine lyase/cysteine desulfurase
VLPDEVEWAGLPDREEAGSPNVVGAVALAAAARALQAIGLDRIAEHERALTAYALERMRAVPGLVLYGGLGGGDRVGVIPFNLHGVPHGLTAAVLGYEAGIGVRHGCFCAQAYVARLMGVSDAERAARPRGESPGMVRVSFGAYNTPEDVDTLVAALADVAHRRDDGRYERTADGEYVPVGLTPIANGFTAESAERALA